MPAYISYLVFGTVLDSIGDLVPNASLKVTTSVGNKTYYSGSDGLYLFDLADIGYTPSETVTVNTIGPYNNELTESTFVVEDYWNESNITLEIRTKAVDVTGYSPPAILHSVGKNPITFDNPLPTKDITDPLREYGMMGGDDENRIYGYVKPTGEWYIMKFEDSTSRYLYARGTTNSAGNWSNRANLNYKTFDVIFG